MKLREFYNYIKDNANPCEPVSFYGTTGTYCINVEGANGVTVSVNEVGFASKRVEVTLRSDATAGPLFASGLLAMLDQQLKSRPNAVVNVILQDASGAEDCVMKDSMWGHIEHRSGNAFACLNGGDDTSVFDSYALSTEDLQVFDIVGEKLKKAMKPQKHNGHIHYVDQEAAAPSPAKTENALENRSRRRLIGFVLYVALFVATVVIMLVAYSKGIDREEVKSFLYLVVIAGSLLFGLLKKKLGVTDKKNPNHK